MSFFYDLNPSTFSKSLFEVQPMAIKKATLFSCTPDQLWQIVGTPDRVDWVPGVTDCVFDGEVRSLNLPGAGSIKERILSRDESNFTMQYSCIESPMPLQSHLAEIELKSTGDQTQMIWRTTVEPAEYEKFIEGSMDGAIDQIHKLLQPG